MIEKTAKVLAAGLLAVIILSGFCFFYLNTGINIANPTRATDYTNLPGSLKATMAEGFCFFRMDENGFNNETVRDEIDVLLMGSSHAESAHMQPEYSINSRMNRLLPDFFTYNIGIPGHTIYRCADNLKSAVEVFKPRKFVVMETSTVTLSRKQMLSVIDGTASPIPTHDTGILFYLQKIPALKDIFNQLSLWRDADRNSAEESVSGGKPGSDAEYERILDRFLKKMRDDVPERCGLIIFYHPSAKIGKNGRYHYAREAGMCRIFREVAEKNRIVFIDMTGIFQNEYETNNILAHGFANTAVGKGHINQTGNRLVAEELVRVIVGGAHEH